MANNSNNVSVDGEVFKLLKIIESASQALENFETNAKEALSEENLVHTLQQAMENDEFRKAFANAILNQMTSARLARAVAEESKDLIREAIHSRVQSLLTTDALAPAVSQILKMVSNGNLPELPDVMTTPRLEDLEPDSVENVNMILQILAGDKAWK